MGKARSGQQTSHSRFDGKSREVTHAQSLQVTLPCRRLHETRNAISPSSLIFDMQM